MWKLESRLKNTTTDVMVEGLLTALFIWEIFLEHLLPARYQADPLNMMRWPIVSFLFLESVFTTSKMAFRTLDPFYKSMSAP